MKTTGTGLKIHGMALFLCLAALFNMHTECSAAPKLLRLVNAHFSDGTTEKWFNYWETPWIYADTPPAGQTFDTWSPAGSSAWRYLDGVNNPVTRFDMPDANMTVTAVYRAAGPTLYHLEARRSNSDGDYAEGTVVNVVAVPRVPDDNGKIFDQWTVVSGATLDRFGDIYSQSTTFIMPGNDCEIAATFKWPPAPHDLVIHNGGPDGEYSPGTVVTISANTPPLGKLFDRWRIDSGADASMFGSIYATPTTFNMPNNDVELTALYKDAVRRWLHVINSDSDGYFYPGDVRTIVARPNPDPTMIFHMWRIDSGADVSMFGSIYLSPTTFVMPDNDVQITALYTNRPATNFTLTVVSGSGSGTYSNGTVVSISADPAPGGTVFDRWTGSDSTYFGSIYATNTTFVMPYANAAITATYVNTYSLTVNNGTGDGSYSNGCFVQISADPPPVDQYFASWYGAPDSRFGSITAPDTTFRMTNGPSVITATYMPGSTNSGSAPPAGGQTKTYAIVSVGTSRGQGRMVIVTGMRRKTWAQYALWSDYNGQIYFKSGEKFYGLVHSNSKLWFSGDPEFFERVSSADSTYGGSTNQCIFRKGFILGAPTNSMAYVTFATMLSKADLVLTGRTDITFNGTDLLINCPDSGWTNRTYALPGDVVIAVCTNASSRDVAVGGALDGRVTIVSERDILITNHVTYASDPATNPASDDALGLIANRDVVVKPSCPNDLKLYAHIMATGNLTPSDDNDGSFGVENYGSGSPRGKLNLWGGIVQNKRGAVGTFSGDTLLTGYDKNYRYDTRFTENPPPEYPPLLDEISFDKWRDM